MPHRADSTKSHVSTISIAPASAVLPREFTLRLSNNRPSLAVYYSPGEFTTHKKKREIIRCGESTAGVTCQWQERVHLFKLFSYIFFAAFSFFASEICISRERCSFTPTSTSCNTSRSSLSPIRGSPSNRIPRRQQPPHNSGESLGMCELVCGE